MLRCTAPLGERHDPFWTELHKLMQDVFEPLFGRLVPYFVEIAAFRLGDLPGDVPYGAGGTVRGEIDHGIKKCGDPLDLLLLHEGESAVLVDDAAHVLLVGPACFPKH